QMATPNIFIPSYPPNISVKELIKPANRKQKKPANAPNAFMIYRANYCREIRNDRKISQPDISSMASQAWKQAPPNVKETYLKLARQAREIYLAQKDENHLITDGDIDSSQSSKSRNRHDFRATIKSDALINNQQNGITEEINPLVFGTIETKEISLSDFKFTNIPYYSDTLENELVVKQNGITEEINPLVFETNETKEISLSDFKFINMQCRIDTLENELAAQQNEINSMREIIFKLFV
ncbi:1676_t:CDS:1, partial [Ambispora gerdemannii]